MHLKEKSYTIRSRLNVTRSILPGGTAGTSCAGLVYPSEEKHGNKEKKKPARQCSCHPQKLINKKGCGINVLASLLRQKDRNPTF